MRYIKFITVTILFLIIVLSILVAVLYLVKNIEKKDLTDADRARAGGQYVKLSEGLTHYQVAGPDTGKVVILVHGFSVPYYIWDGTFEYLANHGYRVIRYDMYGRGFSDRPYLVYRKALYTGQLKDLITALKIKQPVNLAGISFGGAVVTDFTCAYPNLVNKVILVDPAYNIIKPAVPQFVKIFDETITSDSRARSQLFDFKYPAKHHDWVTKYKVQMQYTNFRWAIASTAYNYNYNAIESNTCLNNTHKPVLLVWGKDDRTVPFSYSDSIRRVLKTDFFAVADAAHVPQLEKPEIVNPKIASFLKQ